MTVSSLVTMAQEIMSTNDSSEEKFSHLYTVLYSTVKEVIRRTTKHSFTDEDIEDIASKVWLEVYQKLEHYEPILGKITTWINTIAKRRTIDHIRQADNKNTNLPVIAFDDLFPTQNGDQGDEAPSTEYMIDKDARNPEDVLMDDERWKFISIMVKMQDMPRLMAWLSYLEEKEENSSITYQQIAKRLSDSEGKSVTAKSVERSFARLRDRFRTLYEEEQDEQLS